MSKKRGFTLVELLVVIAISSIMLVTIGGMIVFLSDANGDIIQKSEELTKAQSVATYLRNMLKDEEVNSLDELKDRIFSPGGVIKDEKIKDIGLTYLYFYEKPIEGSSSYFICCMMDFEDRKQFEFILGVVTPSTQEDE